MDQVERGGRHLPRREMRQIAVARAFFTVAVVRGQVREQRGEHDAWRVSERHFGRVGEIQERLTVG